LPEEEERARDLEALVDDALLTEVLMGWDGDPCGCTVCACPLFLDRPDLPMCRDCEAGNHPGDVRQ
jgi:hypothetical protein